MGYRRRAVLGGLCSLSLGGCISEDEPINDNEPQDTPTSAVTVRTVVRTKYVTQTKYITRTREDKRTTTTSEDTPADPTTTQTSARTSTTAPKQSTTAVSQRWETKTGDGFQITPLAVKKFDRLVTSDDGEMTTMTPPERATYVGIKLRVKHIGETEQRFPRTGLELELLYYSESVDDLSLPRTFRDAAGQVYHSYNRIVYAEDYDDGAYPETTVTGWLVFELPQDFDSEQVVLDMDVRDGDDLQWRLD